MYHPTWDKIEAEDSTVHCNVKPFLITQKNSKFAKSKFELGIPPADCSVGYELADGKMLHKVGGGIKIRGYFQKQKFFYELNSIGFTPSSSPSYQDSMMKYTGAFQDGGRAFNDGDSHYTSEVLDGYVSWSPGTVFNFQAGKGKHFWGDGYRSLFLSDVASSYPYFRITADIWKIKYAVMYAMHQDQTNPDGLKENFKKKFGVFHLLSFNATKRWNFAFFENVVWQGTDTNRVRHLDVNYLNPVIFFRPVEYSLGSSDNSMIGFSFRHKTCKYFHWYGQAMFDEFFVKEIRADLSELISPDDTIDSGWWANKYGLQIGWKLFDVAKVKGLFFQQEFNMVRPFTYAHGSVQQNYGHANQSLAHPLGANFVEMVNRVRYDKLKWGIEANLNFAVAGRDTGAVNLGGNIYNSYATRYQEYGNKLLQGEKVKILNAGLAFYYNDFPFKKCISEIGVRMRSESSTNIDKQNAWVYLRLRTSLWNTYTDY